MNTSDEYKHALRDIAGKIQYICNDHDDLQKKFTATNEWLNLACNTLQIVEVWLNNPKDCVYTKEEILKQIGIALAGN